ncbi:MAG: serine hydrolase, partial [Bacteroidota bacterium]
TRDIKSSDKTNYYIASSTKSFTSLLALILDKEGVLSLDDPFVKFFPEVNFPDSLPVEKVKLRDLLTHTSGLHNPGIGFRVAYSGEHTRALLNELIQYTEPNRVGYGRYQYTNVGYNIYTLILENETGKKWQDWLEEKVFNPIGMNRTTAYMSRAEKNNWELARPYLHRGPGKREEGYLMKKDNTMQSAGGLITNAQDLAKWLKIQLNEGKLDGKQIFPKEVIKAAQEIQTPVPVRKGHIFAGKGYGMGWEIGEYDSQKVVHHFGGFPGFYTHVSFMPEKDLGLAVMVNEASVGYRVMNLIAGYMYDFFLDPANTNFDKNQAKSLKKLAERQAKRLIAIQEHEEERAARSWQLSKSHKIYTGEYYNKIYGTIKVYEKGTELWLELGNLKARATAYTRPESIRVEFSPGSGEAILFKWENEKLTGLLSDGDFFEKLK